MKKISGQSWLTFLIETTLSFTFFLVPLFFWSATSEIFEFNKIMLVYLAAIILVALEVMRLLGSPAPQIIRPKLLLVGLLFLGALILASIFSIDQYFSVFGYHARYHGGLLSWISYGVIYFSLTQLSKESFFNLIKMNLLAGLLIAIWGIMEHFGHSPSCLLMTHQFNDSCWVQDVQSRVFATLGQPNWYAAYLAMLLPWGLFFYLEEKRKTAIPAWFLLNVIIFLGFIFAFSRGGTVGLILGLIVFLLVLGRDKLRQTRGKTLALAVVAASLVVIFASPVTIKLTGAPPTREVGTGTVAQGNDTGNTRLWVWQGTLKTFFAHPILGTGLETYGESFYWDRVPEMNRTSEWDFLFNRAHNEYLNYLSTTGVVGTGAYFILLGGYIWVGWRRRRGFTPMVLAASFGSTATYLGQNLFGFTVVPLALLFALNLSTPNLGEKTTAFSLPRVWLKSRRFRPELLLLLPLTLGLLFVLNLWHAELLYDSGNSANSLGLSNQAELYLKEAVNLNPWDPYYRLELAEALAQEATEAGTGDLGERLAREARALGNQALAEGPANLTLRRQFSDILSDLSSIDKNYQIEEGLIRKKSAEYAPTEPRVQFELGSFLERTNELPQAESAYLRALSLKDDWIDPAVKLVEVYLKEGKGDQAKLYLDKARAIDPTDPRLADLAQKVAS